MIILIINTNQYSFEIKTYTGERKTKGNVFWLELNSKIFRRW